MRAYVLTDAALTKQAGRFAWLAIDSENQKNSAFIGQFPIEAWPTFLVIDPETEKIVLKWYGSAKAEDLARLLDDGGRALEGGGDTAQAALARADRLNGEGKPAEAAGAYLQAIQAAGPNWSRRQRAVESLLMAWRAVDNPKECVRAALDLAPGLPRGRSFLSAVDSGLSCAMEGGKAEWAASAIAKLKPLGEEAVRLPDQLADDRAGIFNTLLDVYQEEKNAEAASKLATEFAAFLDNHEKMAPTAEARASLDTYRAMLAIRMKEPTRAIPALEASERDLPNDYNPPARLASLYSAMGRYDDALAANDRALAKVYGPRRIQVLSSRSSIYEKKGDKAAALASIEEAIKLASSQPKNDWQMALLKKQRDRLK
jgi:tetratricopeptide (TPR) repeat protein